MVALADLPASVDVTNLLSETLILGAGFRFDGDETRTLTLTGMAAGAKSDLWIALTNAEAKGLISAGNLELLGDPRTSGHQWTGGHTTDEVVGGGGGGDDGGSGVTFTQPPGSPIELDPGEEVVITHPSVINEMMLVSVFRDSKEVGITNVALDFDLADEGNFTQSDGTNGTDFTAGGAITLHDLGGGTPTAWPDQPMAGLSSPAPFVVSASATYAPQYPAWKAFNRYSDVDQRQFSSGAMPAWIKIDLGSPKLITQYRMRQVVYFPASPKDWIFEGSNDDAAWSTLDTRTGVTTGWGADQTFAVGSPGSYRYYRWSVSAVQSGGSFDMDELYLDEPGSLYPTGTWYSVVTTNANHFDCAAASVINSVTIGATVPGSTSLKMLVSFDGRVTWKKWNGSAWATHAGGVGDIANGNSVAEVQTGLTNYTPGVGEFLDFAWGLHSSSSTASPSVTQVTINYDGITRFDMASVGSYTSGAEFGVRRVDPTQTKIKNLMGTTQTIFANIVTG